MSPWGVTPVNDRSHAALLLEHALAVVSWETERPVDRLREQLLEGDSATHSQFRHVLARIVARELGKLVKAVYVYGSPMENRARLDSDIDLLVVVRGKRRYAARRLAELDHTLVERYRTLIAPNGANMTYLLDFHFVTRRDICQRKGYAAIITDPHALPPEKIYDSTEGLRLAANS